MKKISVVNNKTSQSYGAKLEDAEATTWIASCEEKQKWGLNARVGVDKEFLDAYDLSVATNERSVVVSEAVAEYSYDTYASYDENGVGIGEVVETIVVPARAEVTKLIVDLPQEYVVTVEDITSQVAQDVINADSLKYLMDTDWYVIREMEGGTACPAEIKTERAACRARIV